MGNPSLGGLKNEKQTDNKNIDHNAKYCDDAVISGYVNSGGRIDGFP
jgi:hypothetical protein